MDRDLELLKICFAQSMGILNKISQHSVVMNDPEVNSPQIRVEPADTYIQKAIDLLKSIDPNYFVGVRKIVVSSGSGYGFVESGKDKDPTIININLQKIKSDLQAKMQGVPKDQFEKELVRQIGLTIAHERGHINSFKPDIGFQGGENPAETEANKLKPSIDQKI